MLYITPKKKYLAKETMARNLGHVYMHNDNCMYSFIAVHFALNKRITDLIKLRLDLINSY